MRLRFGFALLFISFLLVVTGQAALAQDSGFNAPPPPLVVLQAGEQRVEGVARVTCWPRGRNNVTCQINTATPAETLSVPSGTIITVGFENSTVTPTEVRIRFPEQDFELILNPAQSTAFPVNLSDGSYRAEVTAYFTVSGLASTLTSLFNVQVGASDLEPTPVVTESLETPEVTPSVEATAAETDVAETLVPTEEMTESPIETVAPTEEASTPTEEPTPAITEEVFVTDEPGVTTTEEALVTDEPTVITTEEAFAPTSTPTSTQFVLPPQATSTPTPSPTQFVALPTATATLTPTQTVQPATATPTATAELETTPEEDATPEIDETLTTPTSPEDAVERPEDPPTMELRISGRTYTPVGLEFCQKNLADELICVNRAVEENAQRIRVAEGSAARLRLEGSRPTETLITLQESTTLQVALSETRVGDNIVLFSLRVPPGSYLLSVQVNWAEVSATYFFQMDIR